MIYTLLIIYAISCLLNFAFCGQYLKDTDKKMQTLDIFLVFTPIVNTAVMFTCIVLSIKTMIEGE
jgi:hypothetical protein